jgi:hypothetical protein
MVFPSSGAADEKVLNTHLAELHPSRSKMIRFRDFPTRNSIKVFQIQLDSFEVVANDDHRVFDLTDIFHSLLVLSTMKFWDVSR